MKYIRTKEGIYEVIELHTTTNENGSFISDYFCKGLRTILAKEVIDISLSIVELCDAKVAIRKSNHKPYLGHFSGTLFFKEDTGWLGRVDSYEAIYGAIWIKGEHDEPILKPVAKMDDKGELCLL